MEALRTLRPLESTAATAPIFARLAHIVALAMLALLGLAGLLIWLRRAEGALVEPLRPAVLVVISLVLALAAIAFRATLLPAPTAYRERRWFQLACAAPTAVLLLWVAGLSLPGTSTAGLMALYGVLVGEEVWSWRRMRQTRALPGESAVAARLTSKADPKPAPLGLAVVEETEETPDGTTQHIVRRRQEDGGETIEGWLRVDFAPGQRHATAHIAICPPMDRVPECFAEPMDGPSADVKVGQVLPYGVRLDVKLDQSADEACSVGVEFSVQAEERL